VPTPQLNKIKKRLPREKKRRSGWWLRRWQRGRFKIFIAIHPINNHTAIDLSPSPCLVPHHLHPFQLSKPCTGPRKFTFRFKSDRTATPSYVYMQILVVLDAFAYSLVKERITVIVIEEENNCTGVQTVVFSFSECYHTVSLELSIS